MSEHLESALRKLQFGSLQGAWSTDFSPDECRAILAEIAPRIEVTTIDEIDGVNPEANT